MTGPLALAKLWKGYPAEAIELARLAPPYDEGARRMLAANGKGRAAVLSEWIDELGPVAGPALWSDIQAAADSLDSEPQKPTDPTPSATVVAYLEQTKSLADALAPAPRLPHIIQGVLPARSLTIVYGPPGSHKTNLALDMAFAVATGTPWLPGLPGHQAEPGQPVTQRPVLWVDADSGDDVLRERLAAFAQAYGALPETPFRLLTFPTPPIQAAKGLGDFITFAKGLDAGLIVFDNLLRFAGVRDENSSEMDAAMSAFRQVSQATGAAVVVIHHRRKQVQADRVGDTMRGHSSIEAALDASLLVQRDGDRIQVTCTKARRKPIADFGAQWCYDHAEDGETLSSARFFRAPGLASKKELQSAALKERILRLLSDEGPLMQSEVVARVKGRRETILQALADLEDAGLVICTPGPHGAKVYSATNA